jgi:hypothetical protein
MPCASDVAEELAPLYGFNSVYESTVSRWETGEVPPPDRVKLALAKFYGVTPEFLMGWDAPKEAA